MFGLGMSEIILLSVMALIIIGPKQLPEVARTVARFINELKRSTEDLKDEFKKQSLGDFELDNYLKQQSEVLPPPVAEEQIEVTHGGSHPEDPVEQLAFETTEEVVEETASPSVAETLEEHTAAKKDGNSEG